MKKIVVALVLYLAQAFYTYGTLTAELEYRSHNYWATLDQHQRDHMGIIVFESAMPCGFILASLASNFNQHGWELTWKTP